MTAPLGGIEDKNLTIQDRYHLQSWYALAAEGFAHVGGSMVTSLHTFRHYQPRVFDYLCRTDPGVSRIAMRRGWLRDVSDRDRAHTAEEIAAVERSRDAALAAFPEASRPLDAPRPRGRADDLALLEILRTSPQAVNRAARIASLCRALNVAPLDTDPWTD